MMAERTRIEPTALGYFPAARLVLRQGLGPLLAYGMLWRGLLLLVFGPLSVAVLNALVQQSGQPAITNVGLLSFGLSALGFFTIVLGAVSALTLTAVESAGLLLILLELFRGRKVTAWQAIYATSTRLPRLLPVILLQVLLVLLTVAPFTGVAALVWRRLLAGSDINYYLARKPPEFLLAATAGAILAVGLSAVLILFYLRWLFAVPVCLFEGQTGRGALGASADVFSCQRARTIGWLAGWQMLRAFVFVAAILGLDQLNRVLLPEQLADGNLVVRTAGCLAIDGLVLLSLSLADTIGYALLVAVLYEGARARRGGPVADIPSMDNVPLATNNRTLRWAAWTVLVLIAGSALGHAALLVSQFAPQRTVGVTAHRAGALKAPENTLAALRQAIEDGADCAEIDVQETADGALVVLHDSDLRRLAGVARNLWEVPFAELRRLDASSGFGPAFQGERIATREEFIAAADSRIKLNIELKYNGHDQKLAERVVALLRQHNFQPQVVITSLEYRGLQEVRRLEPRLRTGFILSASLGDLTKLDVDFLSVRDGLVTPALRRLATERGWEIHAWNLNDRQQIEAMLDRDVDNLITDNVPLAHEVLRQRAALPEVELILRRLHGWMRSGRASRQS